MAIIKKLETRFGVKASYHRITAFNISYIEKKVIICVATYLSKEARLKQKQPIEEIDVEVPDDDYKLFLNGPVIEKAYEWLKQNVIGFEDSLDDLEPGVTDG